MNNRFARGSGMYICEECGKATRKTSDSGAAGLGLCQRCYDVLEWVNGINDGDYTIEDVPEELQESVAAYVGLPDDGGYPE